MGLSVVGQDRTGAAPAEDQAAAGAELGRRPADLRRVGSLIPGGKAAKVTFRPRLDPAPAKAEGFEERRETSGGQNCPPTPAAGEAAEAGAADEIDPSALPPKEKAEGAAKGSPPPEGTST